MSRFRIFPRNTAASEQAQPTLDKQCRHTGHTGSCSHCQQEQLGRWAEQLAQAVQAAAQPAA